MSKRLVIISTAIALTAVAALCFRSCHPRGPVYNGKTVEEWASQLRALDPAAREQAASAIKTVGSNAVPALVHLLETKDTGLRNMAWSVAKRLPRKQRGWFFLNVPWPDPKDACLAGAKGLALVGPDARAAVPALAKALRHPAADIGMEAAVALARIGKASVPALTTALSDNSVRVRHAAAYALGEIGPDAMSAVPALVPMLGETNEALRASVIYSLSRIAPPNVPVLVDRLAHSEGATQEAVAAVLRQYHESMREALPVLARLAAEGSPGVRSQALEALAAIQQGDLATVQLAARTNGNLSMPLRLSVVAALEELITQIQLVPPPLVQSLKDPSPAVRASAAQALARIGGPANSAIPALMKLAGDPDGSVSSTAKEALKVIQAQSNYFSGK